MHQSLKSGPQTGLISYLSTIPWISKIHLRTCVREKLSKSMRFVLVSKVFFNFSFTLWVAPGTIMSCSMITKVRWPIRMSSEVVCDYQWEMLLPWPVEAPSAAIGAGAFILFVLVGDNWVHDTGALATTILGVAVGVGGPCGIRTVELWILIDCKVGRNILAMGLQSCNDFLARVIKMWRINITIYQTSLAWETHHHSTTYQSKQDHWATPQKGSKG